MNKLAIVLLIFVIGCAEGRVKKTKKGTITTQTQGTITIQNKGTITAINWYSSIEEAKKEQEVKNLPLMIDFYADWCIWCKMYDKITFKDSEVIKESLNFIPVKIDCTKDTSIAKAYGILGLPTIIFQGTSGATHSVIGFKMPKDFILEMEKATEKTKK